MAKLLPSEHDEQCTLVQILRRKYPDLLFWATPNEGLRRPSTGRRLKNQGMLAGVPDLFFPELKLFIEMKRQKGYFVSDSQKYVMSRLKDIGYYVHVCKGCNEAMDIIDRFMTVQSCS